MIAQHLHMTVRDIDTRMGLDEYHGWRAFLTYQAEQAKLEANKSK